MKSKRDMDKEVIQEVIVVEGLHDKQAVDRAVIADCIMTQGSTLSEQTLRMIERAQKSRGAIVLTDPDYVGERLRKIISQRIPGCKHAFLIRGDATKKGDIGVENASPTAIREALAKARKHQHKEEGEYDAQTESIQANEAHKEIPWDMMLATGLVGRSDSKERRIVIADALQIGYANGKQLWQRMNALRITEDELIQALIQTKLIEPGKCE